jgi:hypothetical protein
VERDEEYSHSCLCSRRKKYGGNDGDVQNEDHFRWYLLGGEKLIQGANGKRSGQDNKQMVTCTRMEKELEMRGRVRGHSRLPQDARSPLLYLRRHHGDQDDYTVFPGSVGLSITTHHIFTRQTANVGTIACNIAE